MKSNAKRNRSSTDSGDILNYRIIVELYFPARLSDIIVELKEIRLEHEEGAPCTAIREGTVQKKIEILCYHS